MRFKSTVGTPNHRSIKVHTTASAAKKWLRKEIADRREWASRYNHAADADLANISNEINDLDLVALPIGDVREWTAVDEVSGLTFVYSTEKIEQ